MSSFRFMSALRFNERELISYAATTLDAAAKGHVRKVSKKHKAKHLWIVVKCNLLFIFKSNSEPSPESHAHSCYVLEACYPDITEVGFKVVFMDSARASLLSFICDPDKAISWVQAIKEANFRYLRNCLVYYESILSKMSNNNDEFSNNDADSSEKPEKVALMLHLQGLQVQLPGCHIQIQIFSQSGTCILKTSSKPCSSNEIEFYETILLPMHMYNEFYKVSIFRTSSVARQSCYVNIFSTEICPNNIIKGSSNVSDSIHQIDNNNACGILTISFIDMDKALASVTRQSNNRSSCLFSESIQPLPLEEKDRLFSSMFMTKSENNFVINPTQAISGSPVSLLHECLLKLSDIPKVTIKYLEFLNKRDNETLKLIELYGGNNILFGNTNNLEFRIDINQQHTHCLQNTFGAIKRHKSLKKSGYQTLYFPSNLVSYRVKIMDSSFEHYEIYEKTIFSAPTKNTDTVKGGGLYSMLCDDNIKNTFYLCKRFTHYKDKMIHCSAQLESHLACIANALANFDLDEFTRSFKDYEANAHSLISLCANAEVADLVIELATELGDDTNNPLYVWLNDRVIYIDQTWSVASNLRDLISQIEHLTDTCTELVNDYHSDLWVEMLFLPCNKFQRDIQSLIHVSQAALDYKVHCIQNIPTVMNRFIMRSDAVVGQLLLATITTIYSSVYVYMDDVSFWLQLINIGFFVQIESLLSCRGAERIQLEDIYVASELLKNCKIEFNCRDEDHTLPAISGSRYNMLISVPVSTKIYALLLDVCQGYSSRKLNILPMFCNQIIDRTEIILLSESEKQFIQTINGKSVEYVKKILESNPVFYQSIEDGAKLKAIFEQLSLLKELCLSLEEPTRLLPAFQKIGKSLCAGEFEFCFKLIPNVIQNDLHREGRCYQKLFCSYMCIML